MWDMPPGERDGRSVGWGKKARRMRAAGGMFPTRARTAGSRERERLGRAVEMTAGPEVDDGDGGSSPGRFRIAALVSLLLRLVSVLGISQLAVIDSP